jgi:class 3 adenylate cyclase
MAERSFNDLFESAYGSARVQKVARSSSAAGLAAAGTKALGHPEYDFLQIGQAVEGKALVMFLDIRGFTKLCFVYSNEGLLKILQALVEAAVKSVAQFGGHTLEFTGDGVMAVFGDTSSSSEDAALGGLHCTSFVMKGVRDVVNPRLQEAGTDPIRIAVGMEFGDVLWSRIGVLATSQVKPISEVTFLAGKLSTRGYTDSWEAKVGENLAKWIPDEFKEKVKRYEFVLGQKTYSHDLYLFKWQKFGSEFQLNENGLRKKFGGKMLGATVLSAARTAQTDSSRPSPRLLKDQPFF